jgi:hypothetical protein
MGMIPTGVLNPNKKAIEGSTFHLFYRDTKTSYLFDSDLGEPIIWGNKAEVMRTLTRRMSELMGVDRDHKVKVHSYVKDAMGYRRVDTYNGPIETIAKYIRHV